MINKTYDLAFLDQFIKDMVKKSAGISIVCVGSNHNRNICKLDMTLWRESIQTLPNGNLQIFDDVAFDLKTLDKEKVNKIG